MLRGHGILHRLPLLNDITAAGRCAVRSVTTNSAINRSLRKSKSHHDRPSSRYQTPKLFLKDRTSANDKSNPIRKDFPTGETRYDYSPNAEGNRAARRAALYPRKDSLSEHPPKPEYPRLSSRYHRFKNSGTLSNSMSAGREARPMLEVSRVGSLRGVERDRESVYARKSSERSEIPHLRTSAPARLGSRSIGREEPPPAIPYTTPASEFLYGTSVIQAALQAKRRKCYKLYMYDGENREVRDQDATIRRLALDKDVVVQRVKGDWLRLMDKMSQGRPHNGYILEVSPLPKKPVRSLQQVEPLQSSFNVVYDHQSKEDEAVNGTHTQIKCNTKSRKYPFVLLLDGILDSGNLGAIVRSAFYLGVDAVVISSHSAPFSSVALKASAGTAELLPLMTAAQPIAFLDACKGNGWKVYAANAPDHFVAFRSRKLLASDMGDPLQRHPCMLILGSEGEGLRWKIQNKADFEIGIEGQRHGQGGVDSLNVSVAAGLLCEAFLRDRSGLQFGKGQKGTQDAETNSLF